VLTGNAVERYLEHDGQGILPAARRKEMKRVEKVVLNKRDIQEAVLWLCKEEFNVPSDYVLGRDVDVEINSVDSFKDGSMFLEATLTWEDE
jgi:hypothetical protein